ncbi:PilX N-terminal domain-containing pilus assembly protein [Jeongeupia wiesaeckerbachi]|uniref:pilus assembly PilX family protein n=1 Tax=Jeongeupia wiesaeckerbachi TaxID=3051218 RepID=UPI003D802C59
MRAIYKRQQGFVLVVSLILLVIVTILVVNTMRATTMNEKMAGNYMDRNRAYQAAEQALRQGEAVLQNNADACLAGCTTANVTDTGAAVTVMPNSWSDTNAKVAAINNGQATSAKFLVNQLSNSFLPTDKLGCKPYSIMGRGQGIDTRSVVVLQSVAYVCPIS